MAPWKSGRRYSSDLRELVVKAVEEGQTPGAVAQTYRMTLNTVKRYVAQKANGTLHEVKGSGGRPRIVQEYHELQLLKQAKEKNIIGKKITARPDADVQSIQILGLAYKAIAEEKESDKMYKADSLRVNIW